MKTITSMVANWRTTSSALAGLPPAFFAALALTGSAMSAQFDTDPLTVANWPMVGASWAIIASLVGNLFSRDANVTSEQSGAKS